MGFVVQSAAMDSIEPLTFNGLRNILGGLAVLPVCFFTGRGKKDSPPVSPEDRRKNRKTLITGGICCGVCLFAASAAQQIGLIDTAPGKAGFITALYIVLVPLFGLFLGKRVSAKVWVGVGIAVVGLYLLCVTESFTVQKSDLIVLLCSVCYTVHILIIDRFAPKVDGVKMSCIQFFVCGLMNIPFVLIFENPSIASIRSAAGSIFYMGVFSCGIAFTLQIVAQKHVNPTVASLLMSLESGFSAIFSWLILNQTLSKRELVGVLLMAVAIVLSQLPEGRRSSEKSKAKVAAADKQAIG